MLTILPKRMNKFAFEYDEGASFGKRGTNLFLISSVLFGWSINFLLQNFVRMKGESSGTNELR